MNPHVLESKIGIETYLLYYSNTYHLSLYGIGFNEFQA